SAAQERDRQVLRRRHHAQEEAARETEGGQETHEADRLRRGAAGGVSGHSPAGQLMGLLTSALYACLAVFGLGWYFNRWSGNFSLLLFVLTVITFAYWLGSRSYFALGRAAPG